MQWVCLAERPLSLREIRFALALEAEKSLQTLDDMINDDDQMSRLLKSLSGGLIEVKHQNDGNDGNVVQFIHQSVYDFLEQGGLGSLASSPIGLLAQSHYRLSRSCISYFALEEVPSSDLSDPDIMMRNFPFIDYAVTFCFAQAEKAEKLGLSQVDLLEQFYGESRMSIEYWVNAFNVLHPLSEKCPNPKATLLHVSSAYNLLSVAKAILQNGFSVNLMDGYGNTALHDAAWNGHDQIIQFLLQSGANIGSSGRDYGTALEVASERGHKKVVELLLAAEAGPFVLEATNAPGVAALFAAASNGHFKVLKILIKHGANPNFKNEENWTALYVAAANGHQQAVSILLRRNANVDTKTVSGSTALHRAVANGNEAIV
jgi:hypothetical protein